MENLILLSKEVKKEYLRLLQQDIKEWSLEKQLTITSIAFYIEYPDYEIGESDFDINHLEVTLEGNVVSTEYIFNDKGSAEYQLWKKWGRTLEELKKYLVKKTYEYQEKSGFYNLLSFIEDEKIDI